MTAQILITPNRNKLQSDDCYEYETNLIYESIIVYDKRPLV